MSSKQLITALAAAVTALTTPALWAQPSAPGATPATNAPVSREQRKAETAAANKAGQLTEPGQGPMAPAPSTKSTMTREERKAQARADEKAGKMAAPGQGVSPTSGTPSTKSSTMTREQRKAQARADEKAGKMVPAGEGPGSPTK